MGINERLTVLKLHEDLCYSICLYLVRCDQLACEAAEHALLNLIDNDAFFESADSDKRHLLHKESMKCSLLLLSKRARISNTNL